MGTMNPFKIIRESFPAKIFSLLIFLIVVVSILFTENYLRHETVSLTERLVMQGDLLARLLAYNSRLAVFSEDKGMLREAVEGILQHDHVISASVLTADGRVLVNRCKAGAEGEEGCTSEDILSVSQLLKSGSKTVHREKAARIEFFAPVVAGPSFSTPESLYMNGSPVEPGERFSGLVRVVLDKKELNARLQKTLVTGIFMGTLFVMVASLCAFVVARGVTRPLSGLMKGVKTLEQGNLSGRIPVETEDELGKLSHAFNSMAEVLEKREAENRELEEQLRLVQKQEAEEEWERTFDTVPDLIAITDEEHRIVQVNMAMAARLGINKDNAVGTPLNGYLNFSKASPDFSDMTGLLAVGAMRFAEVYDEKSRSFYFVTISPLLKSERSVPGYVYVARDITERKQAEEALRYSEEEFRALFETSRDAIMILGVDGFLDCNKAALDIFGCGSKEQLLAKHPDELSPPQQPDGKDSSEAVRERNEAAYAEGYQFFEWRLRRMDGTIFPAEVLLSRFDLHGKSALQVVIRDVTERKKLQEQLWQSQKIEAIGQLAGGVAHDFNNILTAIIGFANLAEMKLEKEDPSKQYLEQILVAANRAAHLTQGLLAFSRRQVLNPQPTDLSGIVSNVEKLLKRLISEEIELKISLAGHDLIVMADASQIDQVLMNLVTNARDAMPDGGSLTIDTGPFEMGDDFIRTHGYGAVGRYGMLAIKDTGAGMDEATTAHIFEPFFTTKEVGKGTGLGLAIVYGIIKQHNGFITVDSKPGRGTAFRIYLPLIHEEKVPLPVAEETRSVTGGAETLLIVEDDPEVRNLTRTLLETYGYGVIEAVDGEDAVAKFAQHKDDIKLVIMDVVMPKMNGKEAFNEMCRILPGVKALFTSGYTPNVVHKKGVLMEGVNFIPKPSTPRDLLKKIREILAA